MVEQGGERVTEWTKMEQSVVAKKADGKGEMRRASERKNGRVTVREKKTERESSKSG